MLKEKFIANYFSGKKQAKKCLIISGARQVRKTTIVREFSKITPRLLSLIF